MALVDPIYDLGYQGYDSVNSVTQRVADIAKANGISFVGRYLGSGGGKVLQPGELDIILNNGLALLLYYEADIATLAGGTTYRDAEGGNAHTEYDKDPVAAGRAQGKHAREQGIKYGIPKGTCVYFAFDTDIPVSNTYLLNKLADGLSAAKEALGGYYTCGLYAGANVIEAIYAKGICRHFVQACAPAWSSYKMTTLLTAYQYSGSGFAVSQDLGKKLGFGVDLMTCADPVAAGMVIPSGGTFSARYTVMSGAVDNVRQQIVQTSLNKIDPTVFVPRTVAPKRGEHWYMSTENPCMNIMNGMVIPNCFVGSTQFITNNGVITLKKGFDLSRQGEKFEVPTVDGEWHPAEVKFFGKQKLYKVKFTSSTYYCTGNHRWFVQTRRGVRVIPTVNLTQGMRIPYRMCNTEDFTSVVSVEDTGRTECVYCVVEPVTKSFTLSGGEITGNCVGYAHGRFSEIAGRFFNDLPTCDAGNWIDDLKKRNSKELTIGQEPKLGAAAVWKKHGSKGHVAIVEAVNTDGSIMLSESGYSGNWNQRFFTSGPRVKPNYYNDATYSFQGFIYNPGTANVTHIAPFEGGTPYGTVISEDSKSYAEICTEYLVSIESSSVGSYTSTGGGGYSLNSDGSVSYFSEPLHPARRLVQSLLSHLGRDSHDWVMETTDVKKNQGWSAAAICAASKECEFTEEMLPYDKLVSFELCKYLVQYCGATYIVGGAAGGSENPQTGDIFSIYTGSSSSVTKFSSTRVGVVRGVEGDKILTVEGDLKDCILLNQRRARDIYYYIRPDWTKENASLECIGLLESPIYSRLGTKEDAMLREVGYISKDGEPSIKPNKTNSDIKLSAINYTTNLSHLMAFYAMQNGGIIVSSSTGKHYTGSSKVQLNAGWAKGMEENAAACISYMLEKGFNLSQACGIAGNIYVESGFQPGIKYSGPIASNAAGLCQWVGGRRTNMEKFVGDDWETDLTGQLDFLMYELEGSYINCLNSLKQVTDVSVSGARRCADIFCRQFEIPVAGGDPDFESKMAASSAGRQAAAQKIFESVIVLDSKDLKKTSTSAFSKDIHTQSGLHIEVGEAIEIPSWVNQSGISINSSPYDQLFMKWNRQLNQGKLADVWDQSGRKTIYTIAVVDGYFIAGCTTKLGMPGDILSVVLEGNKYFNMIVGDSKGSNPHYGPYDFEDGNEYGHYLGDKSLKLTDIIEWEAVYNGDQQKSARDRQKGLQQIGWLGKKVIKVVNYGSWFR